MNMTISWTREDIERKLRDEIEKSGFRVIEALSPEELGPKKKARRTFQWTTKPGISVSVKAEPDPEAVFDEPKIQYDTEASTDPGAQDPVEDGTGDTDIPEGTGFLPPGAATALNEAVKAENEGRKVERKKMVGQSDERPD
jgi:hypothetical protein